MANRVPYPPDRGDRIRSWQILKHLASHANVDLACTSSEPVAAANMQVLEQLCGRVAIAKLNATRWVKACVSALRGRSASEGAFAASHLKVTLAEWSRTTTYDRAFVYCSSMSPYLESVGITAEQAIIDLIDVDSRKWSDYAEASRGVRRYVYRFEASKVRKLEQRTGRLAAHLLVSTVQEAALAKEVCPRASVLVLPNGVDLDYFGAVDSYGRGGPPSCVFTGVLNYRPNVDAMKWFTSEVWRAIRVEFPDAQLRIVGRNPTRAVRDLAAIDGVDVIGNVPDVRPYLSDSTIAVAPLRIARGVQNKVLEAMAARRPVIASPQALLGIDVVSGKHVVSASSTEEWIAAIRGLFQSRRECQRLAESAREFVELRHGWPLQMSRLDEYLDLRGECSSARHRPHSSAVTPPDTYV